MRIVVFLLAILGVAGFNIGAPAPLLAAQPAGLSLFQPIYEAPMRVVIVRNSDPACEPLCPEWIDAEGEIMTDTPNLFRRVFEKAGDAKLPIVIRSPGGSIEAALEIGQMVRDRKMTVAVGYTHFQGCSPDEPACKLPARNKGIYTGVIEDDQAFCNSACPMLLSGGTTRLAGYLTSIGVHQPKTTWTHENVRYREIYKIVHGKKRVTSRKVVSRRNVQDRITYGLHKSLKKKLTNYYTAMGIGLAILDETTKAKYADIHYLSPQQTDQLHLRTDPLSAVYLAKPALCGSSATRGACVLREGQFLDEPNRSQTDMRPVAVASMAEICTGRCPVWIVASGQITPQTLVDFERLMETYQHTLPPVIFDSEGGDDESAMALADLIRHYGLDAAVGHVTYQKSGCKPWEGCSDKRQAGNPFKGAILNTGTCTGACVFALAGGVHRYADSSSLISLKEQSNNKSGAGKFVSREVLKIHFAELGIAMEVADALLTNKQGQKSLTPSLPRNETSLINARDMPASLMAASHCAGSSTPSNCMWVD